MSLDAPLPPAAPGLAFDTSVAVKHVRAVDPVLAGVVDAVGPFELQPTGASSTFAALSRAIVYQQLHARAAGAIYSRLRSLFPGSAVAPRAEDIVGATDEALLGAGLSRAKLLSIRDLARRAADGALPTLEQARSMDDEAIVEDLSQVRGIGRWTAEMFLIFTLGRPDVLPAGDFGVRKGFGLVYRNGEMPSPKELLAYGERWRPYRTVASWYLWRALEIPTA